MAGESRELLNTTQVAAMFGVDSSTVRKWVKLGQIPAIRTPGGHLRYRRADIEKVLRDSEEK